jgi:hypothetical protein
LHVQSRPAYTFKGYYEPKSTKKKTPLGTDARKKPGTSKVDCMKGKGKEKATRNVTVIRNTVKEVFLLEVC